uniref:Uncharacterized protein n=1 Tax=Globodera rostochiensis TaxID=31243 RepID=A0A914HDF5_GLORO
MSTAANQQAYASATNKKAAILHNIIVRMENIRDQVAPYLPKFLAHYLQALSSDDIAILPITDHCRRNLPSFVLKRQTLLSIAAIAGIEGVKSEPERALTTKDLPFAEYQLTAAYNWQQPVFTPTVIGCLVVVLILVAFAFMICREVRAARKENDEGIRAIRLQMDEMGARIDARLAETRARRQQSVNNALDAHEQRLTQILRDFAGQFGVQIDGQDAN